MTLADATKDGVFYLGIEGMAETGVMKKATGA